MDTHHNNFDFLRWLAASMVLCSHEYAVLGRGGEEPLVRLTGGFATFGTLGVDIFFAISGCLVTTSLVRRGNLAYFVASRALRIVPGLVVALVVTALLIGALATTLPPAEYFQDAGTWRYISRGIALHDLQWTLPGVFATLPASGVVNGSLWSLWPEVQMYAIVALLGAVAWLCRAPRRMVLLAGMTLVAAIALLRHPDLAGQHLESTALARLAVLFAFGAIVGLWGWRARIGWALFVLAAVGAVLLRHSQAFVPLFDLAVVLGVLGVAYAPLGRLRDFGRFGDWSYGMYVYAFPVQQLVALFGPGLVLPAHLAIAYTITLALGALSWHLVEAPALSLKHALVPRFAPPRLNAAQPRG